MTHEYHFRNITIFWNLQVFYKMLLSKQVKWNVIITNKNGKFELTDELPSNTRLNP